MIIPVIDGAGERWHGAIQTAIDRWNAALAYRGISLVHHIGNDCQQALSAPEVIVLCHDPGSWDGVHAAAGGTPAPQQDWDGGVVNFYFTPSDLPKPPVAIALHEIGHAMGLPHSNAEGSVMTPQPESTCPSAEDAAGVFPRMMAPLPASVPTCDDVDQKKRRRKKRRHH